MTSTTLLDSGGKPSGGGHQSADRPLARCSNSRNSQQSSADRRSKRARKGSQQHGDQPSSGSAPSGAPSSTASPGGAGGSWPSIQHPWTDAIHMWPGQRGPTLSLQQQQALLVQQAQQQATFANPAALTQHQALLPHQQALQANMMQAPGSIPGQYTPVHDQDQ